MPIKHRTLDAFVVDELRERIVSGELEAGTKIDQQALAEELGVSRMPVREALRRLSAEGFVELLSHRGAVVVQLSDEEIIEVYEMRGVLQGLASRLAVPNYTDQDVAQIKQLLAKMDATRDVSAWTELNQEFHRHIEAPAGAHRLDELIERLTLQCAPYLQISVHFLQAQSSPQELHHDIYDAVEKRDPEALEAAVRAHLASWGREVAGFVRAKAAESADGDKRAVA
ncbi:MAG TPA: GntR family transcriptional regulator [Thermoleophilaceae bacterium]|jgi:DNA-binding GntR family transcriptional regulator|nr:GntR family transcriptional regulator [Thermoleophilaceae bacterium]